MFKHVICKALLSHKKQHYCWFGTDFLLKGNLLKPPFARSSKPWRSITQFGFNDNGYPLDFMVATTGKEHENNVAKTLDYQPGSMICMDRGCTDYGWWEELPRIGVYFVTRLKSNAIYDEI